MHSYVNTASYKGLKLAQLLGQLGVLLSHLGHSQQRAATMACTRDLAEEKRVSVVEYTLPLHVLKDTYDHRCY